MISLRLNGLVIYLDFVCLKWFAANKIARQAQWMFFRHPL